MGTSLKKVAKKAKDYKYVLMVMRHAKTEPFGNGGDAGRELTDKGRKQAKSVAKGLASFKLVPDRIACSSATRARQTCDRMLKVFGDDPKVDYRQSLYEGGVQSVFDELAQTKEKRRTLLILGHEPVDCQLRIRSDIARPVESGHVPSLDRRVRCGRAVQPMAAAQRRTHRPAYGQGFRLGPGSWRENDHNGWRERLPYRSAWAVFHGGHCFARGLPFRTRDW